MFFAFWFVLALQDSALEEKWEAREAARRRDLAHAQADYSKVKPITVVLATEYQ